MRVLVTGASGFLGSHTVEALAERSHRIRALMRAASRPQHRADQAIERVAGDIVDADAMRRALDGMDAVIHIAGATRAADEAGFSRVNAFGAQVVAEAAVAAGLQRFVLVSSLAARGPRVGFGPVSAYGRSKLAGEQAVLRAAASAVGRSLHVTIVRPTAIYGPRDNALLPFFQLAKWGLRPVLRGGGALSLIHVADLSSALAHLVDARLDSGTVLEASDGHSYDWPQVVSLVAQAVDRPGRPLQLPRELFAVAAALTDAYSWLTRSPQIFGRDKLADLCSPWAASPESLWATVGDQPRFDFALGARMTAGAYREAGLL